MSSTAPTGLEPPGERSLALVMHTWGHPSTFYSWVFMKQYLLVSLVQGWCGTAEHNARQSFWHHVWRSAPRLLLAARQLADSCPAQLLALASSCSGAWNRTVRPPWRRARSCSSSRWALPGSEALLPQRMQGPRADRPVLPAPAGRPRLAAPAAPLPSASNPFLGPPSARPFPGTGGQARRGCARPLEGGRPPGARPGHRAGALPA